MKKTLYILLTLVAGLTLSSCAKSALEKGEVESKFAAKDPLPTVTLSPNVVIDPIAGKATVILSVSGAANLPELQIGVLSSETADFASTSFSEVKPVGEGSFEVDVKVVNKKVNYVKGVASCSSGSAYSEALAIDVPDVPFYYKVRGTYASEKFMSYFENNYAMNFNIVADPEDPLKVKVENFEPYFTANGFTADKGYNVYDGYIDEGNREVVIKAMAEIGYKDVILYGFADPDPDATEETDDIHIAFNESGTEGFIWNAFGAYTVSGGGFYELCYGNLKVTKK